MEMLILRRAVSVFLIYLLSLVSFLLTDGSFGAYLFAARDFRGSIPEWLFVVGMLGLAVATRTLIFASFLMRLLSRHADTKTLPAMNSGNLSLATLIYGPPLFTVCFGVLPETPWVTQDYIIALWSLNIQMNRFLTPPIGILIFALTFDFSRALLYLRLSHPSTVEKLRKR